MLDILANSLVFLLVGSALCHLLLRWLPKTYRNQCKSYAFRLCVFLGYDAQWLKPNDHAMPIKQCTACSGDAGCCSSTAASQKTQAIKWHKI